MPFEHPEIDRQLDGLTPAVRRAVESRLESMSSIHALPDLIAAAKLDEQLAPLVDRAANRDAASREAFDVLWREIAAAVRNTIWSRIRCKTPEHVEVVESQVMEALWLHLGQYRRDLSFFLTWARAYAVNQSRWYKCRTLGAEPPNAEPSAGESRQLPPSACCAELFDMVQDREPHMAVAFLWSKYLDWKPSAIAEEYGDTPLPAVVEAIQVELYSRYPMLARANVTLMKLAKRVSLTPERTLRHCVEPAGQIVVSITRWSNDTKRAVANQVISQAKDFLKMACELPVGSHQTLSFIWNRFLRRTIEELCAKANALLLDLLATFRDEYSGRNDLRDEDLETCTLPLKLRMEKSPKKRLADYSKTDLCAELVLWRDRVQTMLLGPARDRHLVAFSYLCGCLPGIDGPAKRGV